VVIWTSRAVNRSCLLCSAACRTVLNPWFPLCVGPVLDRTMFSLVRALPPRPPPHSRVHPDLTHSRLIPDALAVHISYASRRPTTGSELSSMLFRNIRPLRPRGTFPAAGASTSPKTLALRPAALLALLSDLTRFASSHRELLLPGFRRFGRPPRRRISLRRQLGNLHRRDPVW
jgi:hypothetical protein